MEEHMEYYDLGSDTRKVTTAAPEAQRWFDRGLNWLYGFKFETRILEDSGWMAREQLGQGSAALFRDAFGFVAPSHGWLAQRDG
jgi:hypothetical protein